MTTPRIAPVASISTPWILCLAASLLLPTLAHSQTENRATAADLLPSITLLLDEARIARDYCGNLLGPPDPTLPDFGESPHPHHSDSGKMAEHMAILEMMDYARTTHAAVANGPWNNPNTWHNREVPGDCANVVITEGIQVDYQHQSDHRLNTVRVDGTLRFSTSSSTRMVLDTLFVDPRGTLTIGTSATPVNANAVSEIIIAANGNINTQWDPMLLSRGIVSHGHAVIHGAAKQTHLKVAVDPRQGDTVVQLSSAPSGWRVGDRIVIAGTRYLGWKWDNSIRAVRYFDTQDEVRIITALQNNQITLDQALEHDHLSPRADLKTSVANFSRNVVIRSENADTIPVHQRGHVMFMHSNTVDVRYAEFDELGRTDKSVESFDQDQLTAVVATSNVRGRYSFHFHRTGTSNQRNPAIAVGNAVFGSPGWGYTHHDSHAIFHDNASFNTFGAGFVAETGNETGIWSNNIAIKGEGNSAFNPKNGNDPQAFDIGRTGDGFWFQGRLVRSIDNIAASVNHGFVYFHRGTRMISFPPESFMLPEALGLASNASPDDAPIRNFDGNESFASTVGLYVVKANPRQEHDIITVLSDFTAWEVRAGAAIEYTSHYLLDDFDLIGAPPEAFFSPVFGVDFGTNTSDMIARNVRVRDFPVGIGLGKNHTDPTPLGLDQFVVIDGQYTNVATPLQDYDAGQDLVIASSSLVDDRFQLDMNLPAGRFEYLSPATTFGSGTPYTGTKTDSIGANPLPAGTDGLGIYNQDMIANLAINGYYHDSASNDLYTVVENYFSDRATGEIHKVGFKTYLGPDLVNFLGNPFHAWRDAVDMGTINLASQAPVGNDDVATTTYETDVLINVLGNDTDPEMDSLLIDGIVQPRNGMVFLEGSSILYRPNIGFAGTDTFYYWVSDGHGNYSKAYVTVTVTP